MTCEEEPREWEVSETGVKALNRAGATGPPNNTKEAPQLFGGKTSLGEAVSSAPSSQPGTHADSVSRVVRKNSVTQLSLWICREENPSKIKSKWIFFCPPDFKRNVAKIKSGFSFWFPPEFIIYPWVVIKGEDVPYWDICLRNVSS